MAPGAQPVTLEGQVCRIRSLSKRLTFMDLCCRDAPAAAATAATGSGGAAPDAAAGAAAAPTNALQQPQLQPRAAASERWVEVIAKVSEWEGAAAVRDGIRCAKPRGSGPAAALGPPAPPACLAAGCTPPTGSPTSYVHLKITSIA